MRTLAVIAAVLVINSGSVIVSAQQAESHSMTPAETNELVQRRCAMCHNAETRRGGLTLHLFDAANPDPGLALMMSVKVSADNALFAAGNPLPTQATIDEFVRVLRAAAAQGGNRSGSWIIDLQKDPRMGGSGGHTMVVAQKISDMGAVKLTCNGKTRQFDPDPSQRTSDLDGLSPTLRDVFTWCRAKETEAGK